MMRRLGTTAALSLSVALIACGSDSTNPGPSPDARIFDSPPPTIDGGTGPDAGPGSDAGPSGDAGPSFSGTVAIHSLAALDPTTGDVVANSTRIGQINVSFVQNPVPVESVNIPNGIAPCGAASFNLSDAVVGFNAGNVTFTITHGGAAGPTIPPCVFNTDTMAYQCGDTPIGDVIVDGDSVLVNYAGDGNHFAGYNKSVIAGLKPTLAVATKTLLSSPLDVSGGADLTFAINEVVNAGTGIALVVVIDVTDATEFTADPTDIIGTNATKSANLTCAAAFMNSLTIPKAMLQVLGNLNPTRVRVSVFHDNSDLGLLGTNTNIVVGQGFIEFTTAASAAKR